MISIEKKRKIYAITHVVTVVIIAILSFKLCSVYMETEKHVDHIVTVNNNGKFQKIFNDRELSELKMENKHLYDSIKGLEEQITYLATFKYKYEHIGDTIKNASNDSIVESDNDTTTNIYKYYNPKLDDAFKYELTIGSKKPIDWYKLDFTLDDKFIIVNRKEGNVNETTIESENKGNVEGGFTYSKSNKKKFLDRFVFGPSVTAGYDVVNNKPGIMVGFSATYDLW